MEKRFDYNFAVKEWRKLEEYLKENSLICDISGSLRRKKKDIGDIDFLVEGDLPTILKIIEKYPDIVRRINNEEFLLKSGISIHTIGEKKSEYTYTLWQSTGPKSHVKYIKKVYKEQKKIINLEVEFEKNYIR